MKFQSGNPLSGKTLPGRWQRALSQPRIGVIVEGLRLHRSKMSNRADPTPPMPRRLSSTFAEPTDPKLVIYALAPSVSAMILDKEERYWRTRENGEHGAQPGDHPTPPAQAPSRSI